MRYSSLKSRRFVFGAVLAAFAAGQAMASPIDPLPPFPAATGNLTALASPIDPLPPFPAATGNLTALASPIDPLPPFPAATGSVAVL